MSYICVISTVIHNFLNSQYVSLLSLYLPLLSEALISAPQSSKVLHTSAWARLADNSKGVSPSYGTNRHYKHQVWVKSFYGRTTTKHNTHTYITYPVRHQDVGLDMKYGECLCGERNITSMWKRSECLLNVFSQQINRKIKSVVHFLEWRSFWGNPPNDIFTVLKEGASSAEFSALSWDTGTVFHAM